MHNQKLKLKPTFLPAGDQPAAIAALVDGVKKGMQHQVLFGATGTGKTFVMGKIIEKIQTTVELAGLNPESVENELSSNSRFLSNFNKNILDLYKVNSDKGIVIANFDIDSTSLAYFSSQELLIRESHHLAIGYRLFLKETQINTDTDIKKAEEILRTFDKKNPSSYPVEKIVQPLIRQFASDLKVFIAKNNPSLVLFTNKIYLFPSLATTLSEELSFPINVLNPYPFIKKSQLIETYKNELTIFLPALSANLR